MACKSIYIFIGLMLAACQTTARFEIGTCLESEARGNVKIIDVGNFFGDGTYYRLAVYTGQLKYGAPFHLFLPAESVEKDFVAAPCL